MTNVAKFPIQAPDVWVTKKQLACHPTIDRSTRWVEQRMRLGLPSAMRGNRRVFHLPTALAWFAEHHPDLARTNAQTQRVPAPEPLGEIADEDEPPEEDEEKKDEPPEPERMVELEKRVAALEQRLAELEGPSAA
ncbi:MAG: hypothetical protein ACRDLL_03330 [Solirubrobacterales bacterium]